MEAAAAAATQFLSSHHNHHHLLLLFPLLAAAVYLRTLRRRALEAAGLQRDQARLAERSPPASPLTALVTGANSGVGYSLCVQLAQAGVSVVLACRSAERGGAALSRLRAAVPGCTARLLLLDVVDPGSVLAGVASLRATGTTLDFLFCNAGVMPCDAYRWGVAVTACLNGGLPHFLSTGRSSPDSLHFMAQPEDEVGVGGCPSVFAANVVGHALLVDEAVERGVAGRAASTRPTRIVWTGSRAACAASLDWAHLAPPRVGGDGVPATPSGHVRHVAEGRAGAPAWKPHGETYGESKFAVDLYSVRGGQGGGTYCSGGGTFCFP